MLPERQRNRVRRIAEVPLANWYRRDYPSMTRLFTEHQKNLLWPGISGEDSTRLLKALYAETQATEPLQQVLSVFQKTWLVEDLLMKADKISMASSLELRTPFLDYRLVEWANQRPKRVKMRRTGLFTYETKSIVRRFCVARLPKEIVYRPKRGFPVPSERWLANGLEHWVNDILLGPASRLSRAFSREPLSKTCSEPSGRSENIWLLIILEFWLRVWDVELSKDRPRLGEQLSPFTERVFRAGLMGSFLAYHLNSFSW
jgi:asparagine synthase (glutamine-hydrolysing)